MSAGAPRTPGAAGEAPPLRRASLADLPQLRTAMAAAFQDDPVFGWLIPDAAKRPARLRHFFDVELRHFALPRGMVWTTGDGDGAALVMPPGAWREPLGATLREGRSFGRRIAIAARFGATVEWRHMRDLRGPHYYVRDVGVAPQMQGRGLGSALLAPALELCDREGLPAYLEASSERNAALYERLGFRLVRELRVADSPPLRPMLRSPRRP